MFRMIKILTASLFIPLFAGCASMPELKMPELPDMPELPNGWESLFQSNERAKYTGTDSVGVVDPGQLVGTWQVKNVNATKLEEAFDMQLILKKDKSLAGYIKADFENSIGKFNYDLVGTWSVEGEYITIDPISATETTGNTLAGSGEELFDKFVGNVYEANANYLVILDETDGVAQSYTRLE